MPPFGLPQRMLARLRFCRLSLSCRMSLGCETEASWRTSLAIQPTGKEAAGSYSEGLPVQPISYSTWRNRKFRGSYNTWFHKLWTLEISWNIYLAWGILQMQPFCFETCHIASLFFPCQTVCWCLFLLLFHGSSWTWNGKLAFKSTRAGYCWQSAMAILDVPEPQNLQPWDVINLALLAVDWMFLGKCVNHKTFRKSSRIAIWICSNFFHGRPKRRPKSWRRLPPASPQNPPAIWLRLPGTASPDAAARSECWAAALGMAKEILCVQFR